MSKSIKILTLLLAACTASHISNAAAEDDSPTSTPREAVLFKIHNVSPEKDVDGKVIHCNIGATFYNRTKTNLSNVSLNLEWNDEVIDGVINQEERNDKEQQRTNPKAPRSRYSTAGFTPKNINVSLKLPPIKSMQQVTLKSKVKTNRCFLLLEDMDVVVTNCGSLEAGDTKNAQNKCKDTFFYVSPKMEEYYLEFKEVSLADQLVMEDQKLVGTESEIQRNFDQALETIKSITDDASAPSTKSTNATTTTSTDSQETPKQAE